MNLATSIKRTFKKYFFVGLIIIIPFVVTIKVFLFILEYFDSLIAVRNGRFLYFVPEAFHPDHILHFHIPFLGLIFMVVIVLAVGALSRNYLGVKLLRWSDRSMSHIPMVRVVYNVVKQAIDTVTKNRAQFSRVVMLEYPRKGIFTLAFVTGTPPQDLEYKVGRPALNVFVPTTPNPTSGFYLLVPEEEAVDVALSVEEAFKLIVTCGVVSDTKRA